MKENKEKLFFTEENILN